ncbi:hypothetical protein F4680DRAFT_470466 [Xylaria scruposa]|nr:hypothetical protein F4680DRAFT_470466 [Xylaria scruposa]
MEGRESGTEYYPVHLGVWTNWSRGRIFGSTLTLRRQDADLLIAFTAFFITIVSTRIWRIVCFACHRQYVTPIQQNVVYHQCQAILRNSSSAENGIELLTRVLWDNRKRKGSMRVATTVVVAAVCIAASAVASGFSSQISTTAGAEVLIKSANCGYNIAYIRSDTAAFPFLPLIADAINNAANYAQQCYSNNNTGILDCGRFVTKNIVGHVDTQADCPFSDSICRLGSANVHVDSGFINSHDHFGLNSPPSERILTRHVLHCAPLKTAGFSSQLTTSFGDITLYHYGTMQTGDGVLDYISTASSISSQYSYILSTEAVDSYSNYHLDTIIVRMKDGGIDTRNSAFIPIDLIRRNDANVNMILLSGNGVLFTAPSSDEWYRVSPTESEVLLGNSNASDPDKSDQIYLPLEPGSPLGCAEQFQFCHENTQNCGPLASFDDAVAGAAPLFKTTYDEAFNCVVNSTTAANFAYLINAIEKNSFGSLIDVITQLGPASLASQSTKIGPFQATLPSNQWQLDVIRWSEIYWASLQAGFPSTAYFYPTNSSLLKIRTNFESPDFLKLCNNQKIRSTLYGSFSLFGLLFTFIVGLLIITTSYLLEPVSKILYKRWGYKTYAHLEWTTNATLQLQRLAHEELGFGTWSKGTDEVPATKEGELLACLDLTNPIHPVLGPAKKANIASKETTVSQEAETPQETPRTAVTHEHEQLGKATGSRAGREESGSNAIPDQLAQDSQAVSHRHGNETEINDISRGHSLRKGGDPLGHHTTEYPQP